MKSIFLIENKGLGRLNPEEATRLFQQLLWAESRRLGIPNSKVHISLRTDIADGGIDASIEETNDDFKGDLIKKGLTSYQIKASETLNIHRKSSVKQELFSNKKITKANLGSGVINCLENGGTYILANFGADPTDQQRRDAVTYFKEYFSLCGYLDPSVEIWGQSELAGFINIFPSLTLQIQGLIDERFNTHGEWANQAEMSREYVPGDDQIKIIDSIRHELGSDHGTIHIRIWGEPGIGKTRIALEATRHDAFSPLVLYTKAVNFVDSDLWYFLSRSVNNVAILVVDECDFNNAVSIWNNFKYSGPRIKILTITNEYETSTGNTQYFYIPRLEDDKVIEIINSYGIQKEDARHLSQFCDGSPRVAHILSANFLTNPGDLLRSSDTVNVWDRYIGGMDDLGSPIVQERRLVLEYLALFKKFGFGRPLKEEAAVIQRKINLQNPAITWLKFVEIIKGLKERKILQGEITLYITPKALHIKLWKDWWETYGEHFEFDEFADDLPPPLLDWFLDMFKYAAESDAAKNVIADLFGKNGSFQNKDVIQERLGARFFLSIAEGAPEQALDFLKTYIGRKGVEELRNFTTGRREVIWALEKIVIWKDLFPDAARLLLALGEAENETVSNNASGLFAELFTPGWGKLAQTEASPQDRYPILVEALESESKGKRFLGLEAANRGLQTSHYTRWIGPEHQGIKPSPKLWTPEKWGEIFDAFRQVWELLTIKLPDFDMDEKNKAIAIMLQNARALLNINSLVEMVLETLEVLRREPYSREKEVLKVIIQTIHYDGEKLGRESLNRLITYRNEIEGTDYSSRLKRFIGMNLMEDRFDAEGNQKKEYNLRIKELAELSYKNVDQFLKEVEWLVADSPDNAYNFGYEVGIIDTENILYDELIVIQRRLKKTDNLLLVGGYLRGLNERNSELWESKLDSMMDDPFLIQLIPELTWRSGISNKSMKRLLLLAHTGKMNFLDFYWLGLGQRVNSIDEDLFLELVNYLLVQNNARATSIVLEIFHRYYLSKKSKSRFPKEFTNSLLTHQTLFTRDARSQFHTMDYYYWELIGLAYIKDYPDEGLKLASTILEHFGEEGTIVTYTGYRPVKILINIAHHDPERLWNLVSGFLEPPIKSDNFWILNWLRGNDDYGDEKDGAFSLFPDKLIWNWIDESPDERAPFLARHVPNSLHVREEAICLAREILVRYGNREDVERELIANFSTEGWTGSRSFHIRKKIKDLESFKELEDNHNVISWVDGYIVILKDEYEDARIEEERRYR